MNLVLLFPFILILAVLMTMTGRGGGNFYVVAMIIAGYAMHKSAAMGQFILMLTASAGILIFHKKKMIDWKLAFIIDPPTDIMAIVGGYFSGYVNGLYLKIIFTVLLVLAGFLMLLKVNDKPIIKQKKFGYRHRTYVDYTYVVNLWLAIPITAAVGLAAGALGISGGSFKVPLMVLLCGVPIRIAVGTSSAMVAATAMMGFIEEV